MMKMSGISFHPLKKCKDCSKLNCPVTSHLDEIALDNHTQETAGVLISVLVGFAHRETKRQEKYDMNKKEIKFQKGNHKSVTTTTIITTKSQILQGTALGN